MARSGIPSPETGTMLKNPTGKKGTTHVIQALRFLVQEPRGDRFATARSPEQEKGNHTNNFPTAGRAPSRHPCKPSTVPSRPWLLRRCFLDRLASSLPTTGTLGGS